MSIKTSIAAFAAFIVSAIAANASAATINFDAAPDGDFLLGETYTENGFTIEVIQGNHFSFVGGALYFGPGDGQAPEQNIVSITRDNGGLFTFDRIDFASSVDGTDSEQFHLQAMLNGQVVAFLDNNFSTVQDFTPLNPDFLEFIDEIRIVAIDGGRHAATIFDNLEVTEVPLPAAVWMFLAGLGGLGFARKRGVA